MVKQALELDDARLDELTKLIRESFRVRENEEPVYVDVAGNLARVSLRQHQVIFGRRGSGKSCLLVYYRHNVAPKAKVHTAYLSADTIKTLDYPDVLIRLLLAILEGLPKRKFSARVWARLSQSEDRVEKIIGELRDLLALPVESKLKQTKGSGTSSTNTFGVEAGADGIKAKAGAESSRQ